MLSSATQAAIRAWGGTGGTPSPSLQDFRLVLDPNSAEPDLWGALASGATFSQVVLHGRRDFSIASGSSFEYLTYTLSNVKVSSFQKDSPEAVRDTITLSFTKIAEKFTPRNEDGTPGMPGLPDGTTRASGGGGELASMRLAAIRVRAFASVSLSPV